MITSVCVAFVLLLAAAAALAGNWTPATTRVAANTTLVDFTIKKAAGTVDDVCRNLTITAQTEAASINWDNLKEGFAGCTIAGVNRPVKSNVEWFVTDRGLEQAELKIPPGALSLEIEPGCSIKNKQIFAIEEHFRNGSGANDPSTWGPFSGLFAKWENPAGCDGGGEKEVRIVLNAFVVSNPPNNAAVIKAN